MKEPSDEPLKYLRNYEKGFSKSRYNNSDCNCRNRSTSLNKSRLQKSSIYQKNSETSRKSTVRLQQLRDNDASPAAAQPKEFYFAIPE